jgi:hypothetical protein
MRKNIFAVLLLALFTAGCINFEYKGETFPPTTDIRIYENKKNIPGKYIIMGKCVGSGRYEKFTREEIYKKILEEAEAKGADAVWVYAYQVVPTGLTEPSLLKEDSISVWADDSAETSGWNQLDVDFDGGYGKVGKSRNKGVPRSYTRIVRARFIKFDKNLPKGFDKESFLKNQQNAKKSAVKTTAVKKKAKGDKKILETK